MRASIAENPELAGKCRAWLDGVEVSSRCIEADEEEGYVLVYESMSIDRQPVRKEGIVRIEGPKEAEHGPDS